MNDAIAKAIKLELYNRMMVDRDIASLITKATTNEPDQQPD